MPRCEDFPCCGHEPGCCPDFIDGVQVNMRCVCGAVVPITSRSSLCERCLRDPDDPDQFLPGDEEEDDYAESESDDDSGDQR